MQTCQFSVVIEKDPDGYTAFCPALQGCYTQGTTYEEALSNIQDASASIARIASERTSRQMDSRFRGNDHRAGSTNVHL